MMCEYGSLTRRGRMCTADERPVTTVCLPFHVNQLFMIFGAKSVSRVNRSTPQFGLVVSYGRMNRHHQVPSLRVTPGDILLKRVPL